MDRRMNTMMIRHSIGEKLPLLSTIENDLLKKKAREDFDRKVLARHEATVKKYKDKKCKKQNSKKA